MFKTENYGLRDHSNQTSSTVLSRAAVYFHFFTKDFLGMTTLVSKKKGEVNEFCELTSFILPAGVLLLSAMNDVAAQRADPTPLERRRLGLAPCSSRVSTACKTNT